MKNDHVHDHEFSNNSLKELVILIKYMINHNESHNEELLELAEGLKKSGQDVAYEKVIEAIESFKDGNEILRGALESIKEE